MPFQLVPFLIAAALTTGGQIIQSRAQSQAAKRQDNAAALAITNSSEYNNKADTNIKETIQKTSDINSDKSFDDRAAGNETSLMASLMQDRNDSPGQSQGRLSESFIKGREKSVSDVFAQSKKNAGARARYLAPGQLGQDQAVVNTRGALSQSRIRGAQADKRRVDNIHIENAGRVNPNAMLLGNILQGAGMAYGMSTSMGSTASTVGTGTSKGLETMEKLKSLLNYH